MKLSEIREYIGNILDYQPNITTYNAQLNDVINDQYYKLFTEKPFVFAQKEQIIVARKDVDVTGLTITGTSVYAATAMFDSTMAGNIFAVGESEYEIAWVVSSTQIYLTTAFSGTSVSSGTIRYRYLDMPSDMVEIVQVLKRAMQLSPTEPGRLIPVTRYEDEYYNLPLNEVNLPNYWIQYDDYTLLPPKAPNITEYSTIGGKGNRTLEFALTYVYAGRESALSPSTTLTLTDTEIATWTPVARPNTSGRYYKLYCRNPDFSNKWFHIPELSGGVASIYSPTYSTATNFEVKASDFDDNFILTYGTHNQADGNYQRIRLYPRQDLNYDMTVRYMYRPKRLLDSEDTPEFPSAHHQILAYMALREIFIKHDNNAQAELYAKKSAQEMLKMEQRYLNNIAKRYVKRYMQPTTLDPVPLYAPLKKV